MKYARYENQYVSGIGALKHLIIGVFDTEEKKFIGNTYDETLEAASICGNLSTMDGVAYVHIHLTAGRRDGNAVGGHLQEGTISATGELVVTVIDGIVEREFDEKIGLNVFKF